MSSFWILTETLALGGEAERKDMAWLSICTWIFFGGTFLVLLHPTLLSTTRGLMVVLPV